MKKRILFFLLFTLGISILGSTYAGGRPCSPFMEANYGINFLDKNDTVLLEKINNIDERLSVYSDEKIDDIISKIEVIKEYRFSLRETYISEVYVSDSRIKEKKSFIDSYNYIIRKRKQEAEIKYPDGPPGPLMIGGEFGYDLEEFLFSFYVMTCDHEIDGFESYQEQREYAIFDALLSSVKNHKQERSFSR